MCTNAEKASQEKAKGKKNYIYRGVKKKMTVLILQSNRRPEVSKIDAVSQSRT